MTAARDAAPSRRRAPAADAGPTAPVNGDPAAPAPAERPDAPAAEEATSSPRASGRPALRRIALGLWLLFYLAVLPCFLLWMTFTEVLVASSPRAQDRAPGCVYFTGAGLVERPLPFRGEGVAGPENACPLVRHR